MQFAVYVNYRGTCEQAFRFYEQHLGARLTSLVRHKEQPNPHMAAEWGEKVVHARLDVAGVTVMGADIPHADPMRSAYLTLVLESDSEAERVYAVLVDGGESFVAITKTPFANRFAMLRDRFGTSWMLLHHAPAA